MDLWRALDEPVIGGEVVAGGGLRPFGFEKDRVTLRTAEADLIRVLVARAVAGESVVVLARELNERGVPTTTGGQWRTSGLQRVLCSARIAGWREDAPGARHGPGALGGPFTTPAPWPAIVAREDVEFLRARFAGNRRGAATRRYLLSGVLRCGQCGKPMTGSMRSTGRAIYGCVKPYDGFAGGCGSTFIQVDATDALITAAVRERITDAAFIDRVTHLRAVDPDGGQAALLAHDEARLVELGSDYDDGLISRSEYLTRRDRLATRSAQTQSALQTQTALQSRTRRAALTGFTEPGEFDTQWPAATPERQRAVVAALVDSITVGPAVRGSRTFDPARLHTRWHD